MGGDFPERTRLRANISIILVVAVLSVTFDQTILFSSPAKAGAPDKLARDYTVALPYTDYTLRKRLGDRIGDRSLVFITTVKAETETEAVTAAKRR